MTLRTTSATRRKVVSKSSDVAMTSPTSNNSGSTCRCFSGLFRTDPICVFYDSSGAFSTEYLVPRKELDADKPGLLDAVKGAVAWNSALGTDLIPAARCRHRLNCGSVRRNRGRSPRRIHRGW